MSSRDSHTITDPRLIIQHLMPPKVMDIPHAKYDSVRDSLLDYVNPVFQEGATRLEELLMAGRLNEKEKKHMFGNMEKCIGKLHYLNLKGDAYAFAIRYISIQQQYSIH